MHKLSGIYKEWRGLLFFLVLMTLFRSAVADWYTVPTGSMKPTILEGDRVYVNKMAYGLRVPFTTLPMFTWAQPERGDIVVFHSEQSEKRLIKRVIGLPGDEVALFENRLFINGTAANYSISKLDSASINWSMATSPVVLTEQVSDIQYNVALGNPGSFFGPVRVPDNHLFVLGDNRDNSADSRYIGFVPVTEMLGKANGVIVSLDADQYYIPRSERFFKSFNIDK